MLNRLLFLSSLLCFLIATDTHARQLQVVADTDQFTDYRVNNPDLEVLAPAGITVPYRAGQPGYRILEQSVATVSGKPANGKTLVLSLSGTGASLVESSGPLSYRNRKVEKLSLNLTRYDENKMLVVRNLKIRVYKHSGEQIKSTPSAPKQIQQSSPFADGTWYKIPVKHNSIYELDKAYLDELGIDTDNIDPRNLQLWGTDGYQLPELNSTERPVLGEIPVQVYGEEDGSFDSSDRLVFYGNSPHRVIKNGELYRQEIHPYSDVKYVFLTVGNNNGMRLSQAQSSGSVQRTVTQFHDFIWKNEELYKSEDRLKSGRYWLGQKFNASAEGVETTVLRDTLPGFIPGSRIRFSGVFTGRSTQTMYFDIAVNDNLYTDRLRITRINKYVDSEGASGKTASFSRSFSPQLLENDILELTATLDHNESNTTGFVDELEFTVERELIARDNYLYFYSPADGTEGETGKYVLQGFSEEPVIMDVTDPASPVLIPADAEGNTYTFNYHTGGNRQFVAQSRFRSPASGTEVAAQNLKGISYYPDYIIITAEKFLDQATELADYRQQNDGLSPVVVTQEQILNEFASGAADPIALRDYVKFLWDRATEAGEQLPKYLLFFGDTTYDYKGILENAYTNYVYTYQTRESLHRVGAYGTDDFFAFMDDNEGSFNEDGGTSNSELTDLGVGRIPAQTRSEAASAIAKIKLYESDQVNGAWQNRFTFAADDNFPQTSDQDLHLINADETARLMNTNEPGIRVKKIYEFSYPAEITGGGREVPEATQDLIDAFNQGSLVINYSGHGNEQTLSDENLFTSGYIARLNNTNRLPVLVTATCQFGRYDDRNEQSGAEQLLFTNNGGIIAAFTTTRVVYTSGSVSSSNNFGLNIALSQVMTDRGAGEVIRFGDIYRETKNTYINNRLIVASRNSKKFILLGDPAARFRLPSKKAELLSINDTPVAENDTSLTLRALDRVELQGQITDFSGNVLSDFTGNTMLTVLDAEREVRLPDLDFVLREDCQLEDCEYLVENDVLFQGKVKVENGQFRSEFVIPKDISFSDRNGRIVLFSESGTSTAGGSFSRVNFNGVNPDATDDGKGPQMNVYLNDERFVNGSLVSSSPQLIIELDDESGINTTGTGVGHEIIATIDTKPQQSFVLNDFYEGELNDFTKGRIEYPLDQIPEGSYSLKVRAWDVHNNPSEEEIFFEVASEEDLRIRRVYNYPNPMTNITRFAFEHNQPGNPLDVSVRIFTLSGKPVQHLKESLITTSSYASISWDGRDRDYDRLGNGTYIYVLRVTTDTPEGRKTAEKIEKLVIIR